MANGIDIKIGTLFDKSGITEANKALASLASDVRDHSDKMKQAVLREAAAYDSVAAQADKMAKAVGGSYLDLEKEAQKLEEIVREAFDAQHKAAIEAKFGTESLEKVLQRANAAVLENNRLQAQSAEITKVLAQKRQELAAMEDKNSAAYLKTSHEVKVLEEAQKQMGAAATDAGASGANAAQLIAKANAAAQGNIAAMVSLVNELKDKFGVLKGVSVGTLGAIGAAAVSVFKFFSALKDLVVTVFNLDAVPKEVSEISGKFLDLNNAVEKFKVKMDEAREVAAKQKKIYDEEVDAINRMTKAENELKRAQELSLAVTQEQKDAINRKYNSANADAGETAAQDKRDNERRSLEDERLRLQREIKQAQKQQAEYEKLFANGGQKGTDEALAARDLIEQKEKELEEIQRGIDSIDKADDMARVQIELRRQKESDLEREVEANRRNKTTADIIEYQGSGSTDTFEEYVRKREERKSKDLKKLKEDYGEFLKKNGQAIEGVIRDDDKGLAAFKKMLDDRSALQKKADDDAAADQKRREAELHAQRLANIKSEIAAKETAANGLQTVDQNAQSEFDRAFAMYRDPEKAAAQIAEERDYAADYKQLQKDASRYGGKWRIDELSRLMAAGDTQGQAATLEEWRKSSRFTPEVEAMVRAAAADKTKTTAEDELRKLNKTTEETKTMLESLLTMKGGD